MMHSSNPLPKEKMTAYQRWELASFDAPVVEKNVVVAPPVITQEEIDRREQELAQLRLDAEREGYEAGLIKGCELGLAEGRSKAEEERQILLGLSKEFSQELERVHTEVAGELLDLALDIAKAMLKTALEVRPDLVIPIVSEAIHYIPGVQQPAVLNLHHEDAEIVRERMGDELAQSGWRIVEDPELTRGGCRVDTPSNQIDASLELRWQRVCAALGKEVSWME